jgi:hypothetical protein
MLLMNLMTAKYIYADEAGCLTFNRNNNISRYFIIGTVVLDDWRTVAIALQELRHALIYEGVEVGNYFHATTDNQLVRDRFFEKVKDMDFSVQMTICEKSKAQPQVTVSKSRFYKTPWFFHCKHGLSSPLKGADEVIVTAASIGTAKEKLTFTGALNDVVSQNITAQKAVVDFRPCQADPCLQLADYCTWAVQRKWEKSDLRSYDLISEKITREYDLWEHGSHHYY